MTDTIKNSAAGALSLFRFEGERSGAGLSVIFGGIVSVTALSGEEVVLKAHGARVRLTGKRLNLCLYENRNIEVKGRIESIEFFYGKGR